ncbi:MAG: hypothetical protein J6X89_01365 [Bacteroidales bacterium]|nr:hypothetical protein [Bacteroidales bacterium]
MKKSLLIILVAMCCMTACKPKIHGLSFLDYDVLNQVAVQEYLQPVHPGVRGEVPFWNKFSFKFIYAPAFDFDDVDGAAAYVFSAAGGDNTMLFTSDTPRAALTPVWGELPYGDIALSVQAIDADKQPVGEPQVRNFKKDYPFIGPYGAVSDDYFGAALKAAEYIHTCPIGQLWLENGEPNLGYRFNCYACKIWSATVQCECFLAKNKPELKDEALKIARNAAAALMKYARPAGEPLAYFPPTYFRGNEGEGITGVLDRNQETTMFVEAVCAAKALLDLYDITKDKKYLNFARNIAQTYRNTQAADGSWPMKVNYYTGEPTIPAPCMPTTILQLAQRLKDQYKVKGFEDMVAKSEEWLWKNTLATFNFNGQFEDVRVEDHAPFQDLTNCVAVDCIDYLLAKRKPTEKEVKTCFEMARFAEDQFTLWNSPLGDVYSDSSRERIPFVYEQFDFQVPVDHSTAGVAMAWMRIYERTSNLLALAKAKALVDSLIKVQKEDGCIPTVMHNMEDCNDIWANCTFQSITALSRFAELAK